MFTDLLPDVLLQAVKENFAEDPSALVRDRANWFNRWTNRAKELAKDEQILKAGLPEHVSKSSNRSDFFFGKRF